MKRRPAWSWKGRRVHLAGHTGLVGSGLLRKLQAEGARVTTATHAALDLTDFDGVAKALKKNNPEVVIVAAGRVGGIAANSKFPADFIQQNLMIQANLIHASWKLGIQRLLNFGSGCMYPRESEKPMTPGILMTGRLEPTSQPYAVAKLAGAEMCSAYNRQHGTRYITAIPSNVYGPGDHFDPVRSHVVPALIRRFHEAKKNRAKEVALWGSGRATREFLFVDDLAEACLLLLECYEGNDPVNVSPGRVITVAELGREIARATGFTGRLAWDRTKPDGAGQKSLDSAAIRKLGWRPRTDLAAGLKRTYDWYLSNFAKKS